MDISFVLALKALDIIIRNQGHYRVQAWYQCLPILFAHEQFQESLVGEWIGGVRCDGATICLHHR